MQRRGLQEFKTRYNRKIHEEKSVEKYGGKIFFTNEVTFSSSTLLNSNFNILSKQQSFL